jgi:hypothetical protein
VKGPGSPTEDAKAELPPADEPKKRDADDASEEEHFYDAIFELVPVLRSSVSGEKF